MKSTIIQQVETPYGLATLELERDESRSVVGVFGQGNHWFKVSFQLTDDSCKKLSRTFEPRVNSDNPKDHLRAAVTKASQHVHHMLDIEAFNRKEKGLPELLVVHGQTLIKPSHKVVDP